MQRIRSKAFEITNTAQSDRQQVARIASIKSQELEALFTEAFKELVPQIAINNTIKSQRISEPEARSAIDSLITKDESLSKLMKDLDQRLFLLKERTETLAKTEQLSTFAKRSENHRKAKIRSFTIFTLILIVAIAFIAMYARIFSVPRLANTSSIDVPLLIHQTTASILMLSCLSVMLKTAYSAYSRNRDLETLYDYRISALNVSTILQAGLDQDTPLHDQLKMELAKYIYKDPSIQAQQSNDIDINPIVQIAESALRAK